MEASQEDGVQLSALQTTSVNSPRNALNDQMLLVEQAAVRRQLSND